MYAPDYNYILYNYNNMVNEIPSDFDYKIYSRLYRNGWENINDISKKRSINSYLKTGKPLNWPYRIDKCEVLVYCGAKTGSSTLRKSFREINHNTFHMHIDYLKDLFPIPKLISLKSKDNKLLIVSSYREPVSRHISSYFHAEKLLTEDLDFLIKDFIDKITNNFVNQQKNRPYEAYHPHLENDRKNFDNINIFEKPFNRERGFQVYESDKVKIIMLRFDKINNWEEIIKENTKYKNFVLIPSNLTSEKKSYQLYQKFCNEIVIPRDVLDIMYKFDQDNMNYFYTPQEQEQIKKRWYRNT